MLARIRKRIRMGITARLLLWCLVLIAIFYATTAYLLSGIDVIVAESAEIVHTNHEIGVAVQRMLQQLSKLEDDRKRYEILQDDAYMEAVVQDLSELGDMLEETLAAHPEYQDDLELLTREYTITLKKGADPVRLLMPDQTVAAWMQRLREIRDENQQAMERRLGALNEAASRASRRGLMGLGLIIALGLSGSLLFAFGLNRSLRSIRTALREFGRTGRATSVDVRSRDELGELAQALDRLTARLEREEQMRADFISMLSHEIRTPLTSIRESVDLVGEGAFGDVDPRQKKFLDIAAREAERLSDLLERLMRVSRLEAGRMEVCPAEEDPALLARTALERVRPAAEAKGVTLSGGPYDPGGWGVVWADAGQVGQVLVNLLGNAVKFSPRGGEVALELERADEGAVFTVLDQGPGVAEAERELVFQKWYRGAAGTVEGAGLGLYISRSIVEAHGGRMWVEGRPDGPGSAFRFLLPARGGQ
ncbi:HAMP domain-containing sensor histidine kinase [Paucidesulfovibrio longus]|uniref:HAMP domain-containing sensor histidine kinase n=1 Tax=Paucidesulfovibrio longus TaxID=889 RepID=UPI0003B4C1BB|nr:HAMP domain-containing histidine kinase [Paucidesulfovibrio longus]